MKSAFGLNVILAAIYIFSMILVKVVTNVQEGARRFLGDDPRPRA